MKGLNAWVLSATVISSAAMAAPSNDVALKNHLGAQLTVFARALQDGHAETVKGVISQQLVSRIAYRGSAATFEENLEAFVSREQTKLAREVGNVYALHDGFTVTAVDVEGDVAAASIAVDGRQLPKPFYFVREQGSYKLNIIRPLGITEQGGYTTYDVKNEDNVTRTFACSNSGSSSIAAFGTRSASCYNSCPTYFDGTWFTVGSSGRTDCDYNTWGWDLFIRGGLPVCGSPC
ncbi:MAG TPA: hypothetical protein VEU33_28015 [Archangium sp.]|nr:hypothetical protein [Archangium sp.]